MASTISRNTRADRAAYWPTIGGIFGIIAAGVLLAIIAFFSSMSCGLERGSCGPFPTNLVISRSLLEQANETCLKLADPTVKAILAGLHSDPPAWTHRQSGATIPMSDVWLQPYRANSGEVIVEVQDRSGYGVVLIVMDEGVQPDIRWLTNGLGAAEGNPTSFPPEIRELWPSVDPRLHRICSERRMVHGPFSPGELGAPNAAPPPTAALLTSVKTSIDPTGAVRRHRQHNPADRPSKRRGPPKAGGPHTVCLQPVISSDPTQP